MMMEWGKPTNAASIIRNNLPQKTMSVMKSPVKSIDDHAPVELSVLPTARRRRQAGHTNRWPLLDPLGGDLLGLAQAERAVRVGINTSLRTIMTADWPVRVNDETPAPLPRLSLPPGPGVAPRPQRCPPVHPSQASPEDLFYLRSRRVVHNNQPDVVLECMGSQWELHCPQLIKSGILSDLYMAARQQRTKHQERTGNGRSVYSRHKQCAGKLTVPLVLQLSIKDHTVTKDSLSYALRTMCDAEACPEHWGVGVLSAAALLGLTQLFQRCLTEMIGQISPSTVCDFHRVSCEYQETSLQRACEVWLELYLVTELTGSVCLRDLPFDLLHRTLRSPRVFAGCEYQLLKTVLYWVFLQFNPGVQILPAHRAIISFFTSWPRAGTFLEQREGQKFIPLIQALRLHGITELSHLEEMQQVHVFPESLLLHIFSKHYYTLHSGGDMQVTDFSQQAVRFGMVIEREPQYCSQTVALYGFYFLLKAVNMRETDTHGFSLQRLTHCDPAMSVRACERHPFSMMSERSAAYQISGQARVGGQWQRFCSVTVKQEFGLSKSTCKSQVFRVKGLSLPIFVTFALAFPAL